MAVVALVVALIVLIIVHLITARISDAILDSHVGMIDRVLGFIFGVVRGFILLVIPYMFYELFQPDEKAHSPGSATLFRSPTSRAPATPSAPSWSSTRRPR